MQSLISSSVLASYQKMGINVILGHLPSAVETVSAGGAGAGGETDGPVYRVPYGEGVIEGVDCVLYAIGRSPGTWLR